MEDEPEKARSKSRIPDFASVEEEAEWWDTHSIVDFLDELEPVTLMFAESLSDETGLAEMRDQEEDHAKPSE